MSRVPSNSKKRVRGVEPKGSRASGSRSPGPALATGTDQAGNPNYMQGIQAIFIAGPEHEEAIARRREHPLVTIPRVEIGADAVGVERDHCRRVGTINNGRNSAFPRLRTEFRRRQHKAGGG